MQNNNKKYCQSLSYELKEVFSLQKQPFADVLQNSYSKNIRNFARKHLRWSLFSTACNFIKKRLHQRCFPVNFAKFLKAEQLRATVSQSLKYKTWFIEKNRSLWKTLNEVSSNIKYYFIKNQILRSSMLQLKLYFNHASSHNSFMPAATKMLRTLQQIF